MESKEEIRDREYQEYGLSLEQMRKAGDFIQIENNIVRPLYEGFQIGLILGGSRTKLIYRYVDSKGNVIRKEV